LAMLTFGLAGSYHNRRQAYSDTSTVELLLVHLLDGGISLGLLTVGLMSEWTRRGETKNTRRNRNPWIDQSPCPS